MICNNILLTAQGLAMGPALSGRESSIEPGCEIVRLFFFWWQRAGKSDHEPRPPEMFALEILGR
jgi:hypothetical protein